MIEVEFYRWFQC